MKSLWLSDERGSGKEKQRLMTVSSHQSFFIYILKLTDFSHPERSEGSRSLQCRKKEPINYAPSALRFFASLRFAQNDNISQIPVKIELTNVNTFKSVSLSYISKNMPAWKV